MLTYVQDGYIRLANLEALAWTLTALSILLSAGRYVIRYFTKKRLLWDDLTHLLALLTMIAMVGLFQSMFRDGYYFTAIQRKLVPTPTEDVYIDLYINFRKRADAIATLFFTSTWLVKFTFLLLYRTIFEVNRNFMRAWWLVLMFVFVTYWVAIAGTWTQCGPTKDSFNLTDCIAPKNIEYGYTILKYTCAVSVASDVAIMALPLWMLRTLHMRTSHKIGLAWIFLLGVIIIILDILRTVESIGSSPFSEVAVYDIVEDAMALIVSSISTYRSFWTNRRRKQDESKSFERLYSKSTQTKTSASDQYRLEPMGDESQASRLGDEDALSYGSQSTAAPPHAHV